MLQKLMILSCLLTLAGCGLSLGPQTKTEYVIAHPGHPAKVVKNVKALTLPEGASQPVEQDIGGWEVMPRDHFEALMRKAKLPIAQPDTSGEDLPSPVHP